MLNFIALIRGKLFVLKCRLFGKKVFVKPRLKIFGKLAISGCGTVFIGKNCTISCIKGDKAQYVTIDVTNPNAVVHIGDNVSLYAARISSSYEIIIGDNVLIEESGIADTDFHSIHRSRCAPIDKNWESCRIKIGNRVSIGSRSFVMKHVTIGNDVVVAPGSVVTSSIGAGMFVCGNPAKVYRNLGTE